MAVKSGAKGRPALKLRTLNERQSGAPNNSHEKQCSHEAW